MSINDLTSTDLTPVFLIMLIVIITVLPVGLAIGKKANKDIYGDNECGVIKEERNAKIIARRAIPHPLNQTVSINMVVFELSTGSRVELAIKDLSTYGIMVEGDRGTLKYQGKKFIGFERSGDNEA